VLGVAGDSKNPDQDNKDQYAKQEKIDSGHNYSPSLLINVATTNVATNTTNPTTNTPNRNGADTNWPITKTAKTNLPTSYNALANSKPCVLPNLIIGDSLPQNSGDVKENPLFD